MLFPPYRKCKLVTSGPWLEVAPIALRDVSVIPESPGVSGRGHSIALWAVSDKGDVLCRLGVSELNPAVSTPVPAHPVGPLVVLTDSSRNGTLAVEAGWAQPVLPRPREACRTDGRSTGPEGSPALWVVGAEGEAGVRSCQRPGPGPGVVEAAPRHLQ